MCLCKMITAFRRKIRTALQRGLLLATVVGLFIFVYSYVNLGFCYRIMSQNTLTAMCKKYQSHEYSGSLCEELCGYSDAFTDFKCPENEMNTIVFTATKNGEVYAVKLAKNIKNDLSWTDRAGTAMYPKIENFHHIVKMHIMLSYNITLDDNMIRALVNQEIDKNNPEQMISFWRLFKDNNYMMSKLFDEEAVFPSIYGSCGPFYATESLHMLQSSHRFAQYFSNDWQRKLKFALNVMEYMFRLDETKPEPLKMCNLKPHLFGLTADKQRVKYQSAEYVKVESQIDRRLSNGAQCSRDTDCHWHECMGRCDPYKFSCRSIQQNNNLQIFCKHLVKGGGLFPALTPNLIILLESCANPSKLSGQHVPGRPYAPNTELALRLYNEMKRIYKAIPKT